MVLSSLFLTVSLPSHSFYTTCPRDPHLSLQTASALCCSTCCTRLRFLYNSRELNCSPCLYSSSKPVVELRKLIGLIHTLLTMHNRYCACNRLAQEIFEPKDRTWSPQVACKYSEAVINQFTWRITGAQQYVHEGQCLCTHVQNFLRSTVNNWTVQNVTKTD